MMQLDMFNAPSPAIMRRIDTRLQAADKIAPHKCALQQEVLRYIKEQGVYGATADETAYALAHDILYVRPRVTELKQLGKIYDSGERRKNQKGNTQKVWMAR